MAEEARDVPTFAEAAAEAGLPVQRTAADLIDVAMVVLEWEPASAIVPETGKVTEGFQVTSHLIDSSETVVWFCGQVALLRALRAVRPPFRTTLRKSGRTYIFS